jgi:lipoprotein-releasing system permease protein
VNDYSIIRHGPEYVGARIRPYRQSLKEINEGRSARQLEYAPSLSGFPLMFYELFAGLRYTRSRKRAQGRNRLVSFISLVSILGIALGITTLIVVLSVMNGFQEELRDRTLGVASHIEVESVEGNARVFAWQQVVDDAGSHPEVEAAAPYVNEQGMLVAGEAVRGVQVRGILPGPDRKSVV